MKVPQLIWFLIFIIILQSCLSKDKNVTDCYYVASTNFELIHDGDSAYLYYEREGVEKRLILNIAPPCYFMRRKGKVQDYYFMDVEAQHVMLVTNTAATKAKKEYFGMVNGEECGNKAQGIILEWEKVIISKKIFSGNIYCKDIGLDNLMFWGIAHPEN